MKTFFAIFTISAVAALVITPVVRRVCERFNWLDHSSDERRLHVRPLPRLGGIAIYLAMACGLVPLLFLHNLVTFQLGYVRSKFFATLAPATLVLLFGVYDDLRGAKAPLKFAVQIVAAILLFAMGGRIEVLSIPFVGPVELHFWVSFGLTVIWTVGISNAFNLIDGLDGLAAGAALFATFVMLTVSLMLYNPFVAVVALAMTGSLIGFLRYNFNPASIFLGDSGALFIGFLLAALSVQGTQKASTVIAVAIPLLAFGLPVVDTGIAVARRFISGKPLFQGDREHIHHKLLDRGWSQRRVALVLYGICALLGLMAMMFVVESSRTTGLVLFVIGMAFIIGVGHLRYHEVDELKASYQRNVGERRIRAANNLRVRRASRELSQARVVEDIVHALETVLTSGEFVCAVARLGGDDVDDTGLGSVADPLFPPATRMVVRGSAVHWKWQEDEIDLIQVMGSGSYWCLRIPLATSHGSLGYLNLYRAFDSRPLRMDVNYLCGLLRRELALAVERVLEKDSSAAQENQPSFVASAART